MKSYADSLFSRAMAGDSAAFCAAEGLALSTFTLWRRKLGSSREVITNNDAAMFVALTGSTRTSDVHGQRTDQKGTFLLWCDTRPLQRGKRTNSGLQSVMGKVFFDIGLTN